MRGHPRFRFYGVRPRDWRDGDDEGLVYELAFVREPDEAARAALGDMFEETIAGGPITSLGPWRWSGKWARFAVMPTLPPEGAMWELARHVLWDRFFTAIEDLTQRLCDVVPLEQVVFTNATAPSKGLAARWEAWSRARRVPDRGPPWRDADDDPVFEAARAATRRRMTPTPWWESMLEAHETLS